MVPVDVVTAIVAGCFCNMNQRHVGSAKIPYRTTRLNVGGGVAMNYVQYWILLRTYLRNLLNLRHAYHEPFLCRVQQISSRSPIVRCGGVLRRIESDCVCRRIENQNGKVRSGERLRIVDSNSPMSNRMRLPPTTEDFTTNCRKLLRYTSQFSTAQIDHSSAKVEDSM